MKTKINQETREAIKQIIDMAVNWRILPLQGSTWEPVLPLLLAAPDLLQVCKQILQWADEECLPVGSRGDGLWDELEAAIAKAEGE